MSRDDAPCEFWFYIILGMFVGFLFAYVLDEKSIPEPIGFDIRSIP